MVRRVLCIVAVAALLAGCSSSRSRHVIAGPSASRTTASATDAQVDAGQTAGGPSVSAGGAVSAPSSVRGTAAGSPHVPVGVPRRLPPAPRYTHVTMHVDTDA